MNKGFTIIELIIVILVLFVLLSLSTLHFKKITDDRYLLDTCHKIKVDFKKNRYLSLTSNFMTAQVINTSITFYNVIDNDQNLSFDSSIDNIKKAYSIDYSRFLKSLETSCSHILFSRDGMLLCSDTKEIAKFHIVLSNNHNSCEFKCEDGFKINYYLNGEFVE